MHTQLSSRGRGVRPAATQPQCSPLPALGTSWHHNTRSHARAPSSSCITNRRTLLSPALRHRPILQPLRTPSPSPAAAAAAATAADTPSAAADARAARLAAPVVVIGGGPAGLAAALMLARRGYTQVKVYERLPEPPAPDDLSVWGDFEQASERLYMIGLNGRGQAVLRGLGVMERIDTASSIVSGRLDWQPGAPAGSDPKLTRYTNRTYKTRCIQRDRLASCLLQELRERHAGAVEVTFDARCVGAKWTTRGGQEVCRLTFQKQQQPSRSSSPSASSPAAAVPTAPAAAPAEWVEESSFVVGADGAGSTLRSAMEAANSSSSSSSSSSTPFRVTRFEDKNTIVYRTIPLFWPPELEDSRPGDVNYSARTKAGISLDCLPTKEGPFIGVMLYKPGDARMASLKTAEDVRALFQDLFPAFLPAVREVDLARFAAKGDSSLPTFSYAGPVLHHGTSACLVGDTCHTVKPYFGQGVNSAFEDVAVLQAALEECGDDPGPAVQRYSQMRSKDAEALVVLSHSLDGGFLTFVGPLILDSLLNRLLPGVISPNIIASLQNEKWSFSQIRARKRVDRALQAGLLAGLALLLARVVAGLVSLASKLLGGAGVA